ncbi:MAG: phenylpyruvate tautomerase MIF-related protein [Gammaproteobacteria bacterium]|nr:phenylpyruvate tautomerase MIF-related protein [Gammaproteobacteria bacterium]MDH5594887.1 phenylpyruvate tautomerase MIF-related protein [Gammaproteobacteria bacterium]
MPLLKIKTNIEISEKNETTLLSKASQLTAEQLGKPESYVMVVIETRQSMLFAGSDKPLAYLELKSIGLPENKTGDLSQALCTLINNETGITQDRIYIEFANAERSMWGWNGATF